MALSYIRHIKSQDLNCYLKATTTVVINTTTDKTSDAFSTSGYFSGVFVTRVVSNASADPGVYLDVSVDGGTTYVQYATLHSDLTTTANNKVKAVSNLPDKCRIRVAHATTSSHYRLSVKVNLKTA